MSPPALSACTGVAMFFTKFGSSTDFTLYPTFTQNRMLLTWAQAYIPEKDSISALRVISCSFLALTTFAPTGITLRQESLLQWSILSLNIPSLSTSSLTFWPPLSPTREESLQRASGHSAKSSSLSTSFCALSSA